MRSVAIPGVLRRRDRKHGARSGVRSSGRGGGEMKESGEEFEIAGSGMPSVRTGSVALGKLELTASGA